MKRILLAAAVSLPLAACTSKPLTPPQAQSAVEVRVPVPVPCQVTQVPSSRLPTASLSIGGDIYTAVKLILADRSVLKADRARLSAANSDPCPVAK